ncbi:MAG: hypothetical protein U0326_19565 [Polyangiales bacterium]
MRPPRLVAAVLFGLLSSVVAAQGAHRFHRARLVWRVAPELAGCPGEDAFRREVARRLGAIPFEDDADTTLTISIEASSDGALIGHTQTVLAGGATSPGTPVRVARNACRDLVALLAGRTAVFLEDSAPTVEAPLDAAPPDASVVEVTDAAVVDAPDASRPDASQPDAPQPDAPQPDASPTARPPPSPWRFEAGAGFVGDLAGDTPLWAGGFEAHGRARRAALSLGVELAALLPSSSAEPSPEASLSALTGRFVGVACGHPWRFSLCAVAGVSVTRLSIVGRFGAASEEPLVVSPVVGPRVAFDLVRAGGFALSLRVEGLWVPGAATLQFAEGRTWRDPWRLSAGLGATWSIP